MEGADSCSDEDSARMAQLAYQEWSGKGLVGLYMHLCVCIGNLVRVQQCRRLVRLLRIKAYTHIWTFRMTCSDVKGDGICITQGDGIKFGAELMYNAGS